MVTPAVRALGLCAFATLAVAAGPSLPEPAASPSAPVRSAFEKGGYPWYDAGSDTVKPVWPPRDWNLEWLDRWLQGRKLSGLGLAGHWITFALAMLGLLILLIVLVQLWRVNRPGASDSLDTAGVPGRLLRIEGLPEGLRPRTDDPWAEAVRCRAEGDFARAVICLFAHQLLTLERLRQVRLVPGRTGRQLVRAIDDGQVRAWVEPTLRLFEAVYYGHQTPTAEAFGPVWVAAEAFQRRLAGGRAP
jgi:hypothetical protein